MERLSFFFQGLGLVFGGLGAQRGYVTPRRGDRAQDWANLRGDVARVGADLHLRADAALARNVRQGDGPLHHGAAEK